MNLLKKIKPKTLRILFGLGALGCISVLILSFMHPKRTLFAAQTLSSLNEESYFSETVNNSTNYDLYLKANGISVEYFGLYMATDTRVIKQGTVHYDLIEETSQKSVASGDQPLDGTGNNSFFLLPLSISEPLEGNYHLLLSFSDIDEGNAPAFWVTSDKYSDFTCRYNGEEMDGNLVAILYNYSTSKPLVWDCIFTLCVLGTVYLLLPKNPAGKEDKSR